MTSLVIGMLLESRVEDERNRVAEADNEPSLEEMTTFSIDRAIDRFDGRYRRAWLFTIMRNTTINRARKRMPLAQLPDARVVDALRRLTGPSGRW